MPQMAATNQDSGLERLAVVPPLLEAAEGNDQNELERLLRSSSVRVDEQDVRGRTGLIIASRQGYAQIVELLLEAGADANVCDDDQSTCLHYAIEGNATEIVKLLLQRSNVDIFASNREGVSPLSTAFSRKRLDIMETLLREQMDRVMKVQTGGTDHIQRQNNDIREYHSKLFREAVHFLKKSPESHADEIFIILRKHLKHSLNAATRKCSTNEVTMLHSAAFVGSVEELELLLALTVTSTFLNYCDDEEQTPLHYAAMEGNLEAVKVLAAQNTIKPNIVDRFNRTALQIAMEKNWRYIAFHLQEYPDVQADQDSLYRDKEALVNAANAILVGGALIASVTFASLLQPPLGYDPYVNMHVSPMGSFWVNNGLAFFTALITVICGTRTVVPEYTVYIREEVKMIKKRLKITAVVFFISSDLLFGAYASGAVAAMDPEGTDRWYTFGLIIAGFMLHTVCIVLFIFFSSQKRATTKPHLRPLLGWEDQELLPDVSGSCLKQACRHFPTLWNLGVVVLRKLRKK